jgi:hypothetical protein
LQARKPADLITAWHSFDQAFDADLNTVFLVNSIAYVASNKKVQGIEVIRSVQGQAADQRTVYKTK